MIYVWKVGIWRDYLPFTKEHCRNTPKRHLLNWKHYKIEKNVINGEIKSLRPGWVGEVGADFLFAYITINVICNHCQCLLLPALSADLSQDCTFSITLYINSNVFGKTDTYKTTKFAKIFIPIMLTSLMDVRENIHIGLKSQKHITPHSTVCRDVGTVDKS